MNQTSLMILMIPMIRMMWNYLRIPMLSAEGRL